MPIKKTCSYENNSYRKWQEYFVEVVWIENEGGSFDDWFKLIRSYLVLGENELAIERFNKAKEIFKEDNGLIRQLENLIKDLNN